VLHAVSKIKYQRKGEPNRKQRKGLRRQVSDQIQAKENTQYWK
jgi:hypothetical protein